MKLLPIGMQTFSDLIQGNYIYVDKTKDIYQLLVSGGKYYFLSRPRRFGKSLLLSTLYEIFSGNKELFKGLWIYDKIEWKSYPVIHIDFTAIAYDTPDLLKVSLQETLDQIGNAHNIELKTVNYKTRFGELIKKLAEKEKTVLLIDEYDKPITDFIDQPETANKNRDILRTFYETIKAADKYIKFVFITGVSKFSKVSVFSGLNNLEDITMDENYGAMLGYSQTELFQYFGDRLEQLTEEKKDNRTALVEDIKNWYNGYSWDGRHIMYNPFSILNFFKKKAFGNYWFESGSPTFMIKLVHRYHIDVRQFENYKAGEEIFASFEIDRLHVVSLLFQAGYLTIKEIQPVNRRKKFYILSYPNLEVKEAFLEYLLSDFSSQFADEISVIIENLKESLEKAEIENFIKTLQSVFARIPYDIFIDDRESYYQTVIYIILKLIGIGIQTELETNLGRIDAVIETKNHIYVLEFKLGTAEAALTQIKERKYYERYLNSPKTIQLVGVGFDVENKNIGAYQIEILAK